jgi:endonuclease G, mitochondrial
MKQKILFLLFSTLLSLSFGTFAANSFDGCKEQFAFSQIPVVQVKALSAKTDELCSTGHATLHSGITKTPLYSAEHLTRDRLRDAKELSRTDSFRADGRLSSGREARLTDYTRSGYDRGHIAPNGDMPDTQEQSDSFLLSNIIPQNPSHNRNLWAGIEHVTRVMAARNGEAYVVTGAAFLGNTVRIGSGVAVPTHLYKAIYFPKAGKASAWFSANAEGGEYEVISINELTKRVGIDVFPTLSATAKAEVLEFYKPKKR